MNRLATASIALAALLASAASAAAADLPADRAVLIVSCADGNRPGMQAVAEFLGTNNSSEIYTARGRIMAQVRSECGKANTATVAVVGRKLESNAVVAANTAPRGR
jgi:hypothetical protein